MSKANVAQEPSMDEILASIRRIIETGEDRGGAPASSISRGMRTARLEPSFAPLGARQSEPSDDALTGTSKEPVGDEPRPMLSPFPSAARPEDFPAKVAGPEAQETEDERAPNAVPSGATPDAIVPIGSGMDDDHLTAQLETELAATWDKTEPRHTAPAAPDGRLSSFWGTMEPQAGSDEGTSGGPEAAVAAMTPDVDDGPEPVLDNPVPASAPTVETRAELALEERAAFRPANTDRRPAEGEGDQAGSHPFEDMPLASRSTGSLVAASFEELAEAIRKGELRSLEAMAQDMLRPMLQDWLDDNLPRMVERLVREEIERLARGGRH